MQIHCSTHSVILNVIATQYTCSLNSIYHPANWYSEVTTLSLAARLPRCCTNHSHYINNGWTFSGQTSYACDKPGKICAIASSGWEMLQ